MTDAGSPRGWPFRRKESYSARGDSYRGMTRGGDDSHGVNPSVTGERERGRTGTDIPRRNRMQQQQ